MQCFPTGCLLQYPGVPRASTFFNILLKIHFQNVAKFNVLSVSGYTATNLVKAALGQSLLALPQNVLISLVQYIKTENSRLSTTFNLRLLL